METNHLAPQAYFWTSLNQLRMREGKFSSSSANSAVLHKRPKFWPMMNLPMNNKWNKIKIQIYSVITAHKSHPWSMMNGCKCCWLWRVAQQFWCEIFIRMSQFRWRIQSVLDLFLMMNLNLIDFAFAQFIGEFNLVNFHNFFKILANSTQLTMKWN